MVMKRVYSSESLAEAGHVRTVLEHSGIAAFLKNEQLSGAMGEVPFLECMPEVWVYDDGDAARADRIIRELNSAPAAAAEPWQCKACGETNEGQFAACWKCGAGDEPA